MTVKRKKVGKKMKKLCITLGLICIIILVVVFGKTSETATPRASAYLRMHVRANSNETGDQAVKYRVRDAVVAYLTPLVATCHTKAEAESMLKENLKNISAVATETLCRAGYDYGAVAKLKQEQFPTRVYDGFTLESGIYDALIIELGSGLGENWWCVVYPPLCFTGQSSGGTTVKYRSKILEIINRFRHRQTGGNT